ncbi:MAG: CDP-glycerol glycerophosphotransferase family protein [Treponema sp.]|nr:CDP-glycerol glycerophosphotransferase family protein [Treponema sp.]
MNLYPLYIDPGTGSMLFSILIGVAATLYFVVRALIIKAKTALWGGKNQGAKNRAFCNEVSRANYVIYAEDKRYWNLFKPVLDEFERRELPLQYLTSSKDDPCFESSFKHIAPEYVGEGNKAYARLNLLSADFVLMTTPGIDVYQLKRSKVAKHYSHLLHAPGDATMYRLFGIDYFDSILLTGDYQAQDIRALEKLRSLPEKQLVTVGCPYLDVAANNIQASPALPHPFTVLVSPSWGPSALLARYGEKLLDPLLDTGFHIIVRPHPQSKISESAMLDRLTVRYQDRSNIEWDYEPSNTMSISKADIMISDFSGIIFDYMFLFDKPVIYAKDKIDMRPYDADDLDNEPWQFRILKETGIELSESNFPSIGEVIKQASNSVALTDARRKAKDTAWQRRGKAGELIAGFMIETVAKLTA